MNFGKLDIVTKTFNREPSGARGQNYAGIKVRRWKSEKEGKVGEIEENFTVSDKLFESLKLNTYALAQANLPDAVLLMVVDDQDEVSPAAKIMRASKKKDGTVLTKGKAFINGLLMEALVNRRVLDGETLENQYLGLVDVTAEFQEKPTVVHQIFKLVLDESVDSSEERDEAEQSQEAQQEATVARDNF